MVEDFCVKGNVIIMEDMVRYYVVERLVVFIIYRGYIVYVGFLFVFGGVLFIVKFNFLEVFFEFGDY